MADQYIPLSCTLDDWQVTLASTFIGRRFVMQDGDIKKLYYSISEVADMLEVEPHVLRYWETEFRQLRPRKNKAGRRIYRQVDIDVLHAIKRLLKDDKYTIEGARQVLDRKDRVELLGAGPRKELLALRGFLQRLLEEI